MLEARRSPGLWLRFAAGTAAQWLPVDGGDPHPTGAGFWIAQTLDAPERAALRTLCLPRDSASAHRVMLLARDWPDGSAASDVEADATHALQVLTPRALRAFSAAGPLLSSWEALVPTAAPPVWFDLMRAALARFMGGARDLPIRVHLLPSSPDANGEPWRAFFGVGHKAVQIGSAPFIPETLWEDLLHSAAHAAQPLRLEPLMAEHLASADGQRLAAAFEETPYAPQLRQVPEIDEPDLRDLIRETIVHSLVYQGALRTTGGLPPLDDYWREVAATSSATLAGSSVTTEFSGLYNAWVLGGCALLQPLTQRYLDEGRPIDAAYLREAFAAFTTLESRWRTASP